MFFLYYRDKILLAITSLLIVILQAWMLRYKHPHVLCGGHCSLVFFATSKIEVRRQVSSIAIASGTTAKRFFPVLSTFTIAAPTTAPLPNRSSPKENDDIYLMSILKQQIPLSRKYTNIAFLSSSASSAQLLQNNSDIFTNPTTGRLIRIRPLLSFIRCHSTSPESKSSDYDYDYFVIGAGSGGIASARRAASYSNEARKIKVAIAESYPVIGGTCVNVGCVPKKIMYHAAHIADTIHDMDHYGFGGMEHITFDFSYIKHARDLYIQRLHTIYNRNLDTSKVTQYYGTAQLLSSTNTSTNNSKNSNNGVNSILLTPNDGKPSQIITAKHILIATGGKPIVLDAPGVKEYSITSDGFFQLEELPRKAVIVGGGYIAVELAGIIQALGTETSLVFRHEKALRNFDAMLSDTLDSEMIRQGIVIYRNTNGIKSIEVNSDGTKKMYLNNGEVVDNMNVVIVATGRIPNVDKLNLQGAGVDQTSSGHIITNEFCETNVSGIYALGDVVGKVELTPTAIAAGRRLADRLFGTLGDNAKISYDLVPTVVFSHPTIGTIGLSEQQAIDKYGAENIKVYKSKFTNLFYGPWQVDPDDKPKTGMKLICAGINELIVGLHVIGLGADEMLQGFGIAMKMGATKADFDATIAIHPTAAEEFVTMHPWGSSSYTGAKHSPLYGGKSPEPILK